MLKKTELHEAAYEWITELGGGSVFAHQDLYQFLEQNFAEECAQRGDAAKEPRYKNDARWAVQDAKRDGLLKPMITRGIFQRL